MTSRPACKVIGDKRAAAKDNPFTLNCRLHRMIGGFEPGAAVRVDALHPGRLEPHGPIDFEGIVDQRVVLQVRGTFEGMRAFHEHGAAHRKNLFAHQQLGLDPGIASAAVADGDVDAVIHEVGQFHGGGEADINVAMGLAKAEQPGNEPLGGEGIERADIENPHRLLVHDHGGGRRQAAQHIAHRGGVGSARRREVYGPHAALEELDAQMVLQMADRPADGAVGHMQLIGGLGETQKAGRGFKAAERGERWKLLGHGLPIYD